MIDSIEIDNKKVVIKGIAKEYYEYGMPIGEVINKLKDLKYEISILHIVDEFIKVGWKNSKIIALFKEEQFFTDLDIDSIIQFCSSSYEYQRELIFQSLFGSSKNSSILNTFKKITNEE